MQGDVVSVERVIAARPERIFELVADASKHSLIDGSGTVRGVQDGTPERLRAGAEFGMSMRAGIPYSMVSKVIEYDDNRRIAWQARPKGPVGSLVGGRIWRYELEPREGGTLVRESWDISRDKQRFMLRMGGLPQRTKRNMEKTLERIAELVET
ncbi:MAG: SRPBCC family protein [Actinomycetota bacterium]